MTPVTDGLGSFASGRPTSGGVPGLAGVDPSLGLVLAGTAVVAVAVLVAKLASADTVGSGLTAAGTPLRGALDRVRPDSTETEDVVDESTGQKFLTDRQEIVRLLSENDGQLKQSRIVDATGWSKAKVSRLLSRMESDEKISKIRIGRENLICLRGCEPDIARSERGSETDPQVDVADLDASTDDQRDGS